MRGLSGTDPRCDRAHGASMAIPDQEQVVHMMWVQKQTFLGGRGRDSKAGQQEGKVTWFPYCTLGRPAVQGARPPRWLLLLGDRSWSGRGDIDSPAPGRPCRVLVLGTAAWGRREACWLLVRAPQACCQGPSRPPGEQPRAGHPGSVGPLA